MILVYGVKAMIICFNCSAETKKILDNLFETGQYKDYSEVISVALANQAILKGQLSEKGALIIGDDNVSGLTSPASSKSTTPQTLIHSVELQHSKKTKSNPPPIQEHTLIPALFILDGISEISSSFASLPNDVWITGQEVPLDRWLFGQYNKMIPAKVNCRALAHLLKDEPKGIPIDKGPLQIAEEAAILGQFLTRHDEQNSIGRDEAFSTAFPSTGEEAEKSLLRYANQFVASVNKQGQVSGLLIDLKLINHTGGKNPLLLLTEAGWRFATLQNPILDGTQETPTQKFRSEEVSFLLEHIARSVPAEDFAYRAILTALTEGANTPDKLDAALKKYVSQDPSRNLSESFLSSQRSGAISRMADLGLVTRVRNGVKVSYAITTGGKLYSECVEQTPRGGRHDG